MTTQTENTLPSGWCSATLDQLVPFDGLFKDGDWVESKDQDPNGEVRLIQLADVGDNRFVDKSARYLTTKKSIELNCSYLKQGDILIARMPDPLGRSCIFPLQGESKYVTVVDVCIIRLNAEQVSNRFISYWINSPLIRHKIDTLKSGSTRKRISRKNLATVKFPIPPYAEQHRIVAKIEELFSELDKGIESLKTAREQLKVYRQALLKHAFEGKLTEQWRKDNADKLETADQLLARIKQEREARYQQQLEDWKAAVKQWEVDGKEGKKPAKPKALSPFGALTQKDLENYDELPANWAWTRFENLIEYVTSGSRGWAKYYSSEGATFIRAQNLKYDYLDLSEIAYVSLPNSAEGKRTLTKQFDLLITITGANVTKSAYLKDDIGEAYVSQHVALSRLIDVSHAKYLYLFLISSTAGRRQLEKAAYGAGKPGLNLDNIKDLVVPLCSVAECDFVDQIIEEKLSVVDDQIQGIDASLSKSEALRQSILKKAFSGQLVPQDPADEPASVLLDRIAKEKDEVAAKAKKAKAAKKKPKTNRTATRKVS